MSRRFWSGALIVSLLITTAAAFYVVTQIQNKEIIAMMPVENAAPPHPAAAPVVADPKPAPVEPAPVEKTEVPQKRNILFSLPRPNAKSVFIVGDFNDWKEDVMVKKDRKWQRSVSLEPGSYKYMFVVDKKQMRDPNNKVVSGGKSLITVKPLSPSK